VKNCREKKSITNKFDFPIFLVDEKQDWHHLAPEEIHDLGGQDGFVICVPPCETKTGSFKYSATVRDFGTSIFQSSKIIISGESGMIITSNDRYSDYCEVVRNWGVKNKKYDRDLDYASSNYRLGSIQAYFLIKHLGFIDSIVAKQMKKVKEISEAFVKIVMEPAFPPAMNGIFDCPFFFMVKCRDKINTIEPRSEYPMRNSSIVKSIISSYFPENMQKYEKMNIFETAGLNSRHILDSVNFILIKNILDKSVSEIVKPYLKNR
jgi:dTDP-4-amino-4,6-dideoxygalactose transaminase